MGPGCGNDKIKGESFGIKNVSLRNTKILGRHYKSFSKLRKPLVDGSGYKISCQ